MSGSKPKLPWGWPRQSPKLRSCSNALVSMRRPVAAEIASAVRSARGRSHARMPSTPIAATLVATARACARPRALSGVSAGCSVREALSAVSPCRISRMVISSAYRHNSMRRSGEGGVHGNCTSTEAGGRATQLTPASTRPLPSLPLPFAPYSAATTQRRASFALTPLAMVSAAIDLPDCRHDATTCAMNSALCVRRRRRPWLIWLVIVFTGPRRI